MNKPKRINPAYIVMPILVFIILCSSTVFAAKSEFYKKFESVYKAIDMDLLRHSIEELEIKDFTYQKDLATFQFKSGKMYLLRYIDDRPTTAIFIGEGNASIKVPSHAERMSLLSIAKDSVINEPFKICFIHMADDFDLQLKEKFTSVTKTLKWKDFQQVKESQGEFLFKPNIFHTYDNFFQLTHSLLERNKDGYFWIDFNRYNFTYDPNRPQPVIVGYEFEINDMEITDAVYLNANLTDEISNTDLSNVSYPTTPLSHSIELELGGMEGKNLESAQTDYKILINSDSLKFVNTFLHYNLKVDSIYLNGSPVEYHRRKDFKFIGIILPKYFYKNDTLTLTYWYHGKNFDYIMPYVENKQATEESFKFFVPKGFNYIMPDMGDIGYAGNGLDSFSVEPQLPYSVFYFQGYATNFDTLTKISQLGMPINFLKSKAIIKGRDCFVPDEKYENSMMNAFNFMASTVGAPIGTFGIYIFPEGFISMPGLVEMPQILCYNPGYTEPLGGFNIFTGHAMAMQWFGHQTKPYSDKEQWFELAASEFLSLLFIESEDPSAYYSNLKLHQDSLYKIDQLKRNRPLYAGNRAGFEINTNKGIWMFHMLRMLMLDTETLTDQNFNKFFHRLCLRTNGKVFKNADIIELAEKYYGSDLSWFFNQWLFNFSTPKFDVMYDILQEGTEYYVNVEIEMSKVDKNFTTPILINITDENGTPKLYRETIHSSLTSLSYGPFKKKPSKFTFNEFFSVLSDDNVRKK